MLSPDNQGASAKSLPNLGEARPSVFDELEDKLKDVLNETIAQGILKELTEIRGLGGNHNKRWGIELIQNALDASGGKGVDITIVVEDGKVTFSHNGRSFKEEELIHLIYHGSTKVEAELASGKLGTGFLATHLLSPRVVVSGTLHDTAEFTFVLDRDAEKLEELTRKMKKTWNELPRQPPPVGRKKSSAHHISICPWYRRGKIGLQRGNRYPQADCSIGSCFRQPAQVGDNP